MMVKPGQVSDVCLLLEGTYPYAAGGVSAWVDQIIRGMPDLTFSLFYMGNQKAMRGTPHYKLPENVVSLSEVFLYDKLSPEELTPGKVPREVAKRFYQTLRKFLSGQTDAVRIAKFWELVECLDAGGGKYTFGNLCKDFEAWELQLELYQKLAVTESFIDFFWTTRFLPLPVDPRMREAVAPAGVKLSGLLEPARARVNWRCQACHSCGLGNPQTLSDAML